jgi:hypothetical protein
MHSNFGQCSHLGPRQQLIFLLHCRTKTTSLLGWLFGKQFVRSKRRICHYSLTFALEIVWPIICQRKHFILWKFKLLDTSGKGSLDCNSLNTECWSRSRWNVILCLQYASVWTHRQPIEQETTSKFSFLVLSFFRCFLASFSLSFWVYK